MYCLGALVGMDHRSVRATVADRHTERGGDQDGGGRRVDGPARQPPPSGIPAIFLISTWINSPGVSRCYRRGFSVLVARPPDRGDPARPGSRCSARLRQQDPSHTQCDQHPTVASAATGSLGPVAVSGCGLGTDAADTTDPATPIRPRPGTGPATYAPSWHQPGTVPQRVRLLVASRLGRAHLGLRVLPQVRRRGVSLRRYPDQGSRHPRHGH